MDKDEIGKKDKKVLIIEKKPTFPIPKEIFLKRKEKSVFPPPKRGWINSKPKGKRH